MCSIRFKRPEHLDDENVQALVERGYDAMHLTDDEYQLPTAEADSPQQTPEAPQQKEPALETA